MNIYLVDKLSYLSTLYRPTHKFVHILYSNTIYFF